MSGQCCRARALAALVGRSGPVVLGLLIASLLLLWQAGGAAVLAQGASSGPDQAVAIAGDACPDGSIGQPPSCLAVTGDTRPSQTTVMTVATLAARGREPFSQVLGVSVINPAASSSAPGLGISSPSGAFTPMAPPSNSPPVLA